ncbi:recombinase family protein [Propioniciclava soli]|uniref:Recombinase family protein n=1 Tax=Propioniciclava soli TaxID=2775081 RepID=A0ABZ3C761_9ACTN
MTHPPRSPQSPNEPSHVAIYARISLDRDDTGLGVARQEEECRAYAEARGWTVGTVYIDNDVSATSGKRRPAFEQLLEDRPAHVVVWNLDRLARVSRDLERVLDAGLTVWAIQAGQLDLSTPAGKAVARTVTAWATYEGDIRSERQRAAYRQRAKQGGRGWVNRPFGYELDGTLREAEATLLRQAFADVLQGATTASIARTWNEAGFVGYFGKPFTPHTVKQTMKNARNAGLKVYEGEVVARGDWVAVVDEPTWRAVVDTLTDPKRGRNANGGNKVTTMLSGIATCAHCGTPLWIIRTDVMKRNDGREFKVRKYGCRKGHCSVAQDWLDSVALLALREALPRHMEAWTGPSEEADASRALELRAELATIETKLGELAAAFAADLMTMDQVTTATEGLRQRREATTKELESLTASASAMGWVADLETFFTLPDALDLGKLRSMFANVFESITVAQMPKGRYAKPDRDRVKFTPLA